MLNRGLGVTIYLMEVDKSRSAVYHTNTNYHIVFCPKYRKKVLVGEVAEYLEETVGIEIRPDHVHLFVGKIDPKYSPSDVVKYLKGVKRSIFIQKVS